jgi:hypothetical protein
MFLFSHEKNYKNYLYNCFKSVVFGMNLNKVKVIKVRSKGIYIKNISINNKMLHYDQLSEYYPSNTKIVIFNDNTLSYMPLTEYKERYTDSIRRKQMKSYLLRITELRTTHIKYDSNVPKTIIQPQYLWQETILTDGIGIRVFLHIESYMKYLTGKRAKALEVVKDDYIKLYKFIQGASDYVALLFAHDEIIMENRLIKINKVGKIYGRDVVKDYFHILPGSRDLYARKFSSIKYFAFEARFRYDMDFLGDKYRDYCKIKKLITVQYKYFNNVTKRRIFLPNASYFNPVDLNRLDNQPTGDYKFMHIYRDKIVAKFE